MLEQVAVLNNKRFGKSSEKLDIDNQICFMEVDGNIVYFTVYEIPKHVEDKNTGFLEELLPWSKTLPEHIRKLKKTSDE